MALRSASFQSRPKSPSPVGVGGQSRRSSRLRFILILAIALCFLPKMGSADEQSDNAAKKILSAIKAGPQTSYRMYAVRVGETASARRNLFIADPSLPRRIRVAFAFWVLKGEGRIILIDTGFINQGMIEKWQIEKYRDPVLSLKKLGVLAEQVTDVIITHAHWDHIGGLARFVNARLWITKTELKNIEARNGGHLPKAFRRAARGKRIRQIHAVESVAPGVVVVPTGLHTPGFQYVVVKTNDGNWVFASDLAPLFANFKRRKISGQTSDAARSIAVQDTMLNLVRGDLKRIVPGHEPDIFNMGDIIELTGQDKVSEEDDAVAAPGVDGPGY